MPAKDLLFDAPKSRIWAWLVIAIVAGIGVGFAVPLLASYRAETAYSQNVSRALSSEVLEIPTVEVVPAPVISNAKQVDAQRNDELERLAARNRQLEALVKTLQRRHARNARPKSARQLGPQARW